MASILVVEILVCDILVAILVRGGGATEGAFAKALFCQQKK